MADLSDRTVSDAQKQTNKLKAKIAHSQESEFGEYAREIQDHVRRADRLNAKEFASYSLARNVLDSIPHVSGLVEILLEQVRLETLDHALDPRFKDLERRISEQSQASRELAAARKKRRESVGGFVRVALIILLYVGSIAGCVSYVNQDANNFRGDPMEGLGHLVFAVILFIATAILPALVGNAIGSAIAEALEPQEHDNAKLKAMAKDRDELRTKLAENTAKLAHTRKSADDARSNIRWSETPNLVR